MCKDQDSMCSDGVLYNTVPYVVLGKFYGGRSCVRIKTACVVRGYRTNTVPFVNVMAGDNV